MPKTLRRKKAPTSALKRPPRADSRAVVKFTRGPAGTTSKEGWGVVNAIKAKGISAARISPAARRREGITKAEYASYMKAARSIARRTKHKRKK